MKLSEGFEINENELESLQDKSIAPEALKLFYGTLVKLNLVNDFIELQKCLKDADRALYDLYRFSPSFDRDYFRLEGQLLKCFNKKAKQFRSGVPDKNTELEFLTDWEQQEYESMNDKNLRIKAKKVFCAGKSKLMEKVGSKNILAERDKIVGQLYEIYPDMVNARDISKWIFMVDVYLKSLVKN